MSEPLADDSMHALYRVFAADGSLLYVGITDDPQTRLLQHSRRQPWWPEVSHQTVAWYETREEADNAETMAIALEGPRYNIRKRYAPARAIPFALRGAPRDDVSPNALLPSQLEDAVKCMLDRIGNEPDDEKAVRQASELVRMLRGWLLDINAIRTRRACQFADGRNVPMAVMGEMLGVTKATATTIVGRGRRSAGRPAQNSPAGTGMPPSWLR